MNKHCDKPIMHMEECEIAGLLRLYNKERRINMPYENMTLNPIETNLILNRAADLLEAACAEKDDLK